MKGWQSRQNSSVDAHPKGEPALATLRTFDAPCFQKFQPLLVVTSDATLNKRRISIKNNLVAE
jgi:hypothetical protein